MYSRQACGVHTVLPVFFGILEFVALYSIFLGDKKVGRTDPQFVVSVPGKVKVPSN